jgi:hypothetical protein
MTNLIDREELRKRLEGARETVLETLDAMPSATCGTCKQFRRYFKAKSSLGACRQGVAVYDAVRADFGCSHWEATP